MFSSTFLPEVAKEEDWDHKTTLKYLIRKAGYTGKIDSVLEKVKVTRYQSLRIEMSYEEYKNCINKNIY